MEKYSFLNFQRVSEKENRWKAKGEFDFEIFQDDDEFVAMINLSFVRVNLICANFKEAVNFCGINNSKSLEEKLMKDYQCTVKTFVFDGELKEEVVFNGCRTFKMKQAKNGRIIVKEDDCGVIGSFPKVSFAVDYINFLNTKLTRDFIERLKGKKEKKC